MTLCYYWRMTGSTRRRRRTATGEPLRILGYLRVSTAEQADSRAGLDAQRAAILAEAERRGWEVVAVHEDAGISGKAADNRPALAAALNALAGGHGDALVVAKLDRLSRSMADAVDLLARSSREGWRLVALDLAVDTTTPSGEAMAHVMATFAQLERRMIGQRTKDALAAKKAQGIRLGRRRQLPDEVVARIVREREAGATQTAIAEGLNRDGVPTAQGGACWYQGTVAVVLSYTSRDASSAA
jgi:DNA invertase Pin-like site-specific DNA recombinase